MPISKKYSSARNLLNVLLIAVIYFLSARLGLLLSFQNTNSTPLWIPSGIALAALWLLGRQAFPGIALGAFSVNFFVFLQNNALSPVDALWVSALISIGNTLEALTGYYLMQKMISGKLFEKTKNIFSFAVIAILMCLTSSFIGATAVTLGHLSSWTGYPMVWFTWWLGDAAGVLVIFPLALAWTEPVEKGWNRWLESLGLFSLAGLTAYIVFFDLFEWGDIFFKAYLPLTVLLFIAFRLSQREIITAITVTAAIAVWGTISMQGPFSEKNLHNSLLASQIFICIMTVSILAVKSAVIQFTDSEKSLKKNQEALQGLIRERTENLKRSHREMDVYQKRMQHILDVMLKTSVLDFSVRARVSEKGDEIDAIAVGLNTMAEELESYIKRLHETEERFGSVVENIRDYAIFLVSPDGMVQSWNKGAENIKGYRSNEIIGKHISQFYTEEDLIKGGPANNLRMAVEKGRFETEGWRTRKDGSRFWADVITTSLYNRSGELKGFVKIIRDMTYRMEMEKTLREQKELYEAIVKTQSDLGEGVSITEGMNYIYINEALSNIFGYSRDELLKMTIMDIVVPEEKKILLNRFKERQLGNKPMPAYSETRAIHKSGKIIHLGYSLKFIERDGRQQVFSIVRDITEQKKAEEALKNSEEQISTIIESAPDSVIVIDSNGRITRWNKEAERTFGWKSEEVIGKYLHEVIIPERFRERHKAGMKHFLATGKGPVLNRRIEMPALQRNNTEVEMELTISPTIVKGEYFFISFLRDITERKKAEQLIKESEEKFNKTFMASPAGILVTRLSDQKYIDANNAIAEITGYSRQEIIGHTSAELGMILEPETRQKILEQINRFGSAKNIEIKIHHKSGRTIDILNSMDTISLQGETHVINVVYDITEQKLAEGKIMKLNKELEQSVEQLRVVNKELESFSYTVSHDLRAPLRAIHGYTKILSEDYFNKMDADAKKMMDAVMANSKKMGQLIDDLLTFSRLGRNEPQRESINMMELTAGVLTDINKNMPNKAKITTRELPSLQSDYSLMHQVMYNLISNAVKYSSKKDNPEVEIGSIKKDGHDIFYVRDNGAGFDMKYYDKLFGVFQRLHSPEEFEGTGVGLAIIQRIINKQGGKVWAEGKKGEGATFYFTLNNKI